MTYTGKHTLCNAEGQECTVEVHDHTTPVDREGCSVDPPIPMFCNDCNKPAHYDEGDCLYHHDDLEAECFLIPSITIPWKSRIGGQSNGN